MAEPVTRGGSRRPLQSDLFGEGEAEELSMWRNLVLNM